MNMPTADPIDEFVESVFAVVGTSEAERVAEDKIARVYGDRAAYDVCRLRLGMTDEHAANFERYGVVLLPHQMEFAVWARQCDFPDGPEELGIGGTKGPGKSYGLYAVGGLDDCLRFPGLKMLYLRFTGKAAQEQLEDLTLSVLRYVPSDVIEVQRERVVFNNGSRILIGGFKDDREALKYAGIENDVLVKEEATQLTGKTHETLNLTNRSSKVYEGVAWRPRIYNSTNPLGIGHMAYKKAFVDNERKRERGEPFDPRRKFIFAKPTDNVFLNPEYIGKLDDLTGAEYRAYRLGDWDVSAGAYFEGWDERIHVIPPITDISWARECWASMDFGYNHWNVVYLHIMDGDGIRYTIDELAHRKRYPEEIAPDIHRWLAQYGLQRDDLLYFLVGSDAFAETGRARASIAQQYAQLGLQMSRADTSPGSRVAGALYCAQLMGSRERRIAPRWYCTSKCIRLRETLPYLERDPNHPEDVLKVNADEQGNGGDDAYDGWRYGIHKPHVTTLS